MGRNPDLDGAFTPNILNSVVFLITMTMQVSTFAVNYQVCLGRVFAMDESSVWPLHVLPSSRVVPLCPLLRFGRVWLSNRGTRS